MEPFIGDWFSKEYVQKHVFRMTEDEIESMQKQMETEPELDTDDEDEN
jgi:type III secretory pathway component EscU